MAIGLSLSSRARGALGGIAPMTTGGDEDLDWDNPYGDSGLTSTSGGSSTSAASLMNAETARRKFEAEQAAARTAAERLQAGQTAQAAYLRGQIGAGIPSTITGELATQEEAARKFIQDQYANALATLGGRRTTAEQNIRGASDVLRSYLEQNVPQAYATAQQATPTVAQNVLSRYMASRGIATEPTQQAVDVINAELAGGAANYNQLLNVLAAAERQQQQSRLAEQEMARTAGLGQLETLFGGATAGLEQERLAALNELASRISASRLQAQQQQAARDQALSDALAALIGQGYVQPTTTEVPGVVTAPAAPAVSSAVQQLANKLPGIRNEELANRVENFVASNPNATPAQIKRQFPSLGANITR